MIKYIDEFLGTFVLMHIIVCTICWGFPIGPFLVTLILIIAIYIAGPSSAAHFNPAVSIAMFIRNQINSKVLFYYILVQILGAILGAYSALAWNGECIPLQTASLDTGSNILFEFIGTFILVWVILFVATTKRTAGNNYYGIAIGLTVLFCILLFGNYCAACYNPAVGLGLRSVNVLTTTDMVITIATNLVAGLAAGLLFNKLDNWIDPV